MDINTFNGTVRAQLDYCEKLLTKKGKEYAPDEDRDRLAVFKTAAKLEGTTPEQALAGMMAKHTVSIYDMCSSGEKYEMDVWSEKITDHINYLLLLRALVLDEERR